MDSPTPSAFVITIANLHESFDAQDWAREFVKLAREKPDMPFDEGAMIAWFANALMRGHDEHAWRTDAVPASALYGFVAWLSCRDETTTIGGTHDCAPLPPLIERFRKSQGYAELSDGWEKALQPYPTDEPVTADNEDCPTVDMHPAPAFDLDAELAHLSKAWALDNGASSKDTFLTMAAIAAQSRIRAEFARLEADARRYVELRRIVFEDMELLEVMRTTAPKVFDGAVDAAAEASDVRIPRSHYDPFGDALD